MYLSVLAHLTLCVVRACACGAVRGVWRRVACFVRVMCVVRCVRVVCVVSVVYVKCVQFRLLLAIPLWHQGFLRLGMLRAHCDGVFFSKCLPVRCVSHLGFLPCSLLLVHSLCFRCFALARRPSCPPPWSLVRVCKSVDRRCPTGVSKSVIAQKPASELSAASGAQGSGETAPTYCDDQLHPVQGFAVSRSHSFLSLFFSHGTPLQKQVRARTGHSLGDTLKHSAFPGKGCWCWTVTERSRQHRFRSAIASWRVRH